MNVLDLNVKLHWKIVFLFSKINLKAILKKKIYTDFKLTWRKLATNSTHRQANNLQIKHTKSVFHNTYIWKYRFDILSIFIHLLCSTITYPAVPRIVFFILQYLPCPPPPPPKELKSVSSCSTYPAPQELKSFLLCSVYMVRLTATTRVIRNASNTLCTL